MALAPGASVGAYEVISLVGAGGMGEVYRARDRKLNRDVALKVLPDAFAVDADRLARFKREAQVLASLNNPSPGFMTSVGLILGTAAYMSPEQARGKPVDKRTDIWAFGCVLYEMGDWFDELKRLVPTN